MGWLHRIKVITTSAMIPKDHTITKCLSMLNHMLYLLVLVSKENLCRPRIYSCWLPWFQSNVFWIEIVILLAPVISEVTITWNCSFVGWKDCVGSRNGIGWSTAPSVMTKISAFLYCNVCSCVCGSEGILIKREKERIVDSVPPPLWVCWLWVRICMDSFQVEL